MRLIDADALEELIDVKGANLGITSANRCNFKDMIKLTSAVDAEPVKHGHWENPYLNYYGHPCHCCSRCGFKASHYDKNYCPNCGAKMDGGITDDT